MWKYPSHRIHESGRDTLPSTRELLCHRSIDHPARLLSFSVLGSPTFFYRIGHIFISAPGKKIIIDRRRVIRRKTATDPIPCLSLVISHHHLVPTYDLHVFQSLTSPFRAYPDVLHHLRQSLFWEKVQDYTIGKLCRCLQHFRSQCGHINWLCTFSYPLTIAVALNCLAVIAGFFTVQHLLNSSVVSFTLVKGFSKVWPCQFSIIGWLDDPSPRIKRPFDSSHNTLAVEANTAGVLV